MRWSDPGAAAIVAPASRPLGALLLAAALSATVAVAPATATIGEPDDPAQELERTQEQLKASEADLVELQRRIDAVEAEVAAADARLSDLQGRLAVVQHELGEAQATAETATDAVAEAQVALRGAAAEQAAAETRWHEARSALEARVAATWMHGSTGTGDALLGGLLKADDLHDVAVVQQTSRRLLDHDRQLLEGAVVASIAAAEASGQAEVQQQQVEQLAGAAYAARDVAEQLVAQQAALVAQAEETRSDREAALRSIEQDADAKRALVERLDAKIQELRLATLDQWLQQIADIPFDGPPPAWAGRLPAAGQRVAPAINAAAARAGVDGRLLAALVWTESSFNHSAISPAGAIGLAQLMPGTAAGLGVDPYDPLENLTGGARYLRTQLERFGRIDLALAAYNAGPGRVVEAGNEVPDIVETQLYVLRVLDRWESLG